MDQPALLPNPRQKARANGSPSPRYPINLLVRYAVPLEAGRGARGGVGRTRDLDLTGACLDLPERVTPGAPIDLLLEEETGRSLDLQATVVWAQSPVLAGEGSVLHGVVFAQLRAAERVEVENLIQRSSGGPSRIVLPEPMPAVAGGTNVHLLDISLGGARLEHFRLLRPGSPCTLAVSAASGELYLPARVVRSRIVGEDRGADDRWRIKYESGLFFTLMPAQAAALAQFVEHLTRETAGIAHVFLHLPPASTGDAPATPDGFPMAATKDPEQALA